MSGGWPLSLRLAMRELRGGIRGFRIFLLCLALGVATIAGVGSVSSGVERALRDDSRQLLGGDLAVSLYGRAASDAEFVTLAREGEISAIVEMRAMAIRNDRETRTLVELKGVDQAYPLYGTLELSPPLAAATPAEMLAPRDGVFGAAVDRHLLAQLGVGLGEVVEVGEARFEIRAVIAREPDRVASTLTFGPRMLVSRAAMEESGLIRPGSMLHYRYRVKLPGKSGGGEAQIWRADTLAAFPDAGWRIQEAADVLPPVRYFIDRVGLFLSLVGLTALLIGGVGVANAVAAHMDSKVRTIAIFKCLGAPAGLIFRCYMILVLCLATAGIALGLLAGAAVPWGLVLWGKEALPVSVAAGIYPLPLALAALYGLLTALAFSLWPLARAQDVPPSALFQSRVQPLRRWPPLRFRLAGGAIFLALAGLAIFTAGDRVLAAWFVGGALAVIVVFRLCALSIMRVAARFPRLGNPVWRLALANLHRPGAATSAVTISLGLGFTVLVAIAAIEANLGREISDRLPDQAPAFYFIDIQEDQAPAFDRIAGEVPGVGRVVRAPHIRGRIQRLNGVLVDQVAVDPAVEWVVRGDRGVTYAARPPDGSRVIAGQWWPEDYAGPPLVSFGAEAARGLGLEVGDTLTVNVLGREITGTIANLRDINWSTLGINYVMVFSPGALAGAPLTYIATVEAEAIAEGPLLRAVTDRLPNVSAIAVGDVLATASEILADIGLAVRGVAVVALLAGVLVLAGAVAAGHRRRVYEAVVLKVLGATRRRVLSIFAAEYFCLGLATALVAAAMGGIAAWLVTTRLMAASWGWPFTAILATATLAVLFVMVGGLSGSYRALGVSATRFLRND